MRFRQHWGKGLKSLWLVPGLVQPPMMGANYRVGRLLVRIDACTGLGQAALWVRGGRSAGIQANSFQSEYLISRIFYSMRLGIVA